MDAIKMCSCQMHICLFEMFRGMCPVWNSRVKLFIEYVINSF